MYTTGDEDDPASLQKLDIGSIAYRLFAMTFGDDTSTSIRVGNPRSFINARGEVWL